jgi:hypothetical protein
MHKRSSMNVDAAVAKVVDPVSATAKNPAAVSLGRLGGLKGGPARAAALSERKRKEIARKAARARWDGVE